jgi:hypothetical protein
LTVDIEEPLPDACLEVLSLPKHITDLLRMSAPDAALLQSKLSECARKLRVDVSELSRRPVLETDIEVGPGRRAEQAATHDVLIERTLCLLGVVDGPLTSATARELYAAPRASEPSEFGLLSVTELRLLEVRVEEAARALELELALSLASSALAVGAGLLRA